MENEHTFLIILGTVSLVLLTGFNIPPPVRRPEHSVSGCYNVLLCWTPQGAVSGSVQASDRLMKELREIYRSQSYKTGTSCHPPTPTFQDCILLM